MLVCFSVGNVWAASHTTTFDKNATTLAGDLSSVTVGDITWDLGLTVGAGEPTIAKGSSNSVECLKFGSSKSIYYNPVTFTTDYFTDYNVTSVKVTIVNNGKKTGTFTAKQGDVTIGSESKEFGNSGLTVLTATGTSGAGGDLVLTYSVEQAFYLRSIEVTYDDASATACDDPTFSVASHTFYADAIDVELECGTSGASIYYTLDGTDPSASSSLYEGAISISATTTVKAIAVKDGLDDSNIVSETYTKGEFVTDTYDVDFEAGDLLAYANWSFVNAAIASTAITPHGGTYYANTSGKGSASLTTKAAVARPGVLKFYTSKESTNSTASTWTVQTSADGSTWTDVAELDATIGGKGEWTERVVDLTGRTDVYIQIAYAGSTAVRAIDDITLTEAAAASVAAPAFDPETEVFEDEVEVKLTCLTEGAEIHYTLDGSEPSAASALYSAPFKLSATTTVKAIAIKDAVLSSIAEKTYTKVEPLETMEAIFAAATATETDVYVKFNNWVVSAISGSNAYVTDGTKGLIIYTSSHGLKANDKLNGLVATKLVKYQGSAELKGVKAADLTVTNDGVITPLAVNIASLGGANTGAPIIVNEVTYDETNLVLVDASDNTIKPYNKLYADMAFENGKKYNVTGIYLQYNDTKEIMPRTAADIEEATVTPTEVTLYFVNSSSWAAVNAYVWEDGADPYVAWPGEAATKEAEQVNGYDLYSYTFPVEYDRIIFNNNNNGSQTADEVAAWDASKPYYYDGVWYSSIAAIPADTYTVAGSSTELFGGESAWDVTLTANDMTLSEGLYVWEKKGVTLSAGDIEFKVVKNHAWANGAWPGENWVLNTITEAGDYDVKITFNLSTKEITAVATKQVAPDPSTSYTIKFKDSGADSDNSTKRTTIEEIISEGADYVSAVAATNIYNARTGRGIKLGTGSATGELVLTLANSAKVTSIVVNAMRYKDGEATLKVQDKSDYTLTEEFADYTYTYAEATEIETITLATTSKRNYIVSVTINTEAGSTDPTPAIKANGIDFGEVKIEASETAYALDTVVAVTGEYLTDGIVATTTSTAITIANSPLPAVGGTLQLHIEAPVGVFSETITLTSGEVSKEILIKGTVKQKPAELVGDFDTIYVWNGKRGDVAATEAIEQGGTAAAYGGNTNIVVGTAQKTNWTMKLNKGFANEFFVGITLDQALAKGDKLQVAAFRTSETSAILGIDFSESEEAASTACQILHDDDLQVISTNAAPEDEIFDIPEAAAGAKFIRIYRNSGSTGIYVANFSIYREKVPVVTHTYTVAGSEAILGIAWDPSATINDMIEQPDGTYKLIKEDVTLHKATEYGYKVAIDHDWNHGEAGSNSTLTVEKDGRYNVTFTYDPVAPETSHSVELIQEIIIDPVAVIAGELAHNGWLPGDTLTLSSDKKSASITLEGLAAGSYEFKMVINGEWQSADGEGDSKYTFHRGWKEAAHIKGGSRNMILEADVAGDYGVTWFFDNDSIAFTFPAPAPVYPDYFLKNNWGTAEWTWKQTTRDSEGLYRLENVVYGGTGVNFNTVAADNDDSKFVAHENLKYTNGSAIAPYDTVNFVLDPANDTIWAELVSKDVTRYSLSGSSLALFFNEWAPCHYYKYTDLNKLNDGSGNYDHKRSDVTLPAGEIEYKVVKNCSFDPAEDGGSWPVENAKLTIGESGIYDVTFTFNPATGAVNAEAVLKSAVTIQSLVVKGDWDDWAGTSLTMDSYSEKALGYVTLAAGDYEFKLQNEFSQWLGAGEAYSRDDNAHSGIVVSSGANMTLDADVAGEYLFTFVFETNQLIVTFPSKVPDVKIAALEGEFSINNSNGKAKFSRGNLQYNFGDNAWYAAEKQYEILSDLNLRFGDDTYSGSIDLFGWSCTNSNYGLLKSNKDADFTGDFVDWGDKFVGGTETWSTLSEAEWKYILGRKKGEQSLWTMASIGPDSITGLVLFPDKWNEPTGLDHTLTYGFFNLDDEATLKGNSISFSEWAELEAAGAVFLPMTGARVGYVGNTTDGALNPINGSFCWVDNVVYYGYYWLSTPDSRTDYQHCAKYVLLPGWDEGPTTSDDDDLWTAPVVWSRERRRGDAVRLVYKYTVDPTAIDNAEFGEQVVKMLKDNQVVIIKGDKTFNIVGQRIR